MPRVLVVDDDPNILTFVASALKEESYEVVTASNGERAIACLLEALPDILILDVIVLAGLYTHRIIAGGVALGVALSPWLLLPALPVIFAILAFNFLGDGLRDAADPYGS